MTTFRKSKENGHIQEEKKIFCVGIFPTLNTVDVNILVRLYYKITPIEIINGIYFGPTIEFNIY